MHPPDASDPKESGAPIGFWRLPWVQNVLPLATSIVVHAGIILVGVAFFLGARYVVRKTVTQVQVVIPDSRIINDRPPGISTGGANTLPAMVRPSDVPDGDPSGFTHTPRSGPPLDQPTNDPATSSDPLIGVSLGGGGFAGGEDGVGGAGRPFGVPGGGGGGSGGPVFVRSGNARKLAFVCDASGSMLVKFAALRRELVHTIQGLAPNQAFNVIFFQEENAKALDPTSLVIATPQNMMKAADFLEDKVAPRGTTDPIPGLVMAFKQRPQLIYLLTDGDFPDNQAVLDKIRELNKDQKVKINTIAFVGPNDTDTDFIRLLKKIAAENGGVYKFVKEGDL